MAKYIVKRLLVLIPILLGVTLIIFTIMDFTPGDPAVRILGPESSIEAREQLREELGLNQPFWVRFFDYVKDAFLKLDFGNSYRTGKPVFDDIFMRLPVSIKVAFLGMLLATVMGLPLGVLSAVKQYSPADSFLRVASTVLVAMPTFWLAMLLILVFALYLGWLPAGGALTWQSYILPTITVGVPYGSKVLRMTRSTMLEEIRQDYVRTARSKGVPEKKVIYGHALKNALLPVITTIGSAFGAILGGSVIAESVFNLPGLGSLIVLSIKAKDTPSVLASVLLLAVFFALIMLIVDLVYAFIDPRIKAKYADFGSQWGKDYKRETVIYTMGSGANYGEMYSLAICLFMEMQWIHSNCIHSGEYFHGPFEVTDFDVPFVLVKGIGATRELDERAYNFCSKFSQKLAVIDEAEFDLTGIEPGVQEYVAPLLAGTVVREMIDSLAHERGHALSVRRYMWQMEY